MENPAPPIYPTGDQVAAVKPFYPGVSAPAFSQHLIRDALKAVDGANPPLSSSKNSKERYAAPVIAQAIAPHRGDRACDVEGKAVLDYLIRTELVRVEPVKISRPGGRSDDRNGLVLTPAGKAVVRQVQNQDPKQSANGVAPPRNVFSPQSPHTPLSVAGRLRGARARIR